MAEYKALVQGGEIAVRVYSPGGQGPHPALVFYHGLGWVNGDPYTQDGICRSLTNAAGCMVASVDYRLAPESRYPVAAADSYADLAWGRPRCSAGDRRAPRGGGRRQRGRQPGRGGRADGARPGRARRSSSRR